MSHTPGGTREGARTEIAEQNSRRICLPIEWVHSTLYILSLHWPTTYTTTSHQRATPDRIIVLELLVSSTTQSHKAKEAYSAQ